MQGDPAGCANNLHAALQNNTGEYKSSKYIVESLRDEDGFAKSEGAYPVTHILSKRNDEPFYHEVVYLDERESIETLPPLAAELVRLTDEAGT